jgi:hypothetical protein
MVSAAYGRNLMFWPRPRFKVTGCDLESAVALETYPLSAQDEDRAVFGEGPRLERVARIKVAAVCVCRPRTA